MDPLLNNTEDLTISSTTEDTITLSSYPWSNTTIAGGGYTVNNASVSASSYPYTVTGAGGYPNVTIGSGTGISSPIWSTSSTIKGAVIELEGEGADIEINGESLMGLMKEIRDRLNLITINEKMEKEWEELHALGEQYRALEAKLKEQGEMWAKLKAMPPPAID